MPGQHSTCYIEDWFRLLEANVRRNCEATYFRIAVNAQKITWTVNSDRKLKLRGNGTGYVQRRRGLHATSSLFSHFPAL
jgi:hypothetical protein